MRFFFHTSLNYFPCTVIFQSHTSCSLKSPTFHFFCSYLSAILVTLQRNILFFLSSNQTPCTRHTMIRYYAKENGLLQTLTALQPACWVNIAPPIREEELSEIAKFFDIPLDFLTDSLDTEERSRYERDGEAKLILITTPILNETEKQGEPIFITIPIGIIITLQHIITISSQETPVIELFLDGKVKNFDPKDDKLFVLQLLEQNVYRFLSCLKKLNIKRNLIEQELYDSSRNEELKQLLSIEKSLVYFVNSLSSNELLNMKMKRTDFLQLGKDEDRNEIFEDIIIDNSQARDMANVYTNIIASTIDSVASIISNNLNKDINQLTYITIFLAVPTLIASLFGMNVPNGLENNKWAVPLIMLGSVLLSAIIFWAFRRKRML
jgi:magnesium transporter